MGGKNIYSFVYSHAWNGSIIKEISPETPKTEALSWNSGNTAR